MANIYGIKAIIRLIVISNSHDNGGKASSNEGLGSSRCVCLYLDSFSESIFAPSAGAL